MYTTKIVLTLILTRLEETLLKVAELLLGFDDFCEFCQNAVQGVAGNYSLITARRHWGSSPVPQMTNDVQVVCF